MILSSVRAQTVAVCVGLALAGLVLSTASAQTNYYSPNGTEYAIVGQLPGDQMFPDAAITPTNGLVVWQDNATDGDGWGISARRLGGALSGVFSPFRVNVLGAGDQEHPRVAMLKNGGAVIVWQGGKEGFQHIYARFLTPTNTFLSTNDILVTSFTNNFQINPAVAVLTNGNVAVVWASYDQASSTSMQDVYGQILSTNGTKLGTNFLVNQFTTWNQRAPTVAALKNGGFVVAWVSEQERVLAPPLGSNSVYTTSSTAPRSSVDVYARLFSTNGAPASSEILVNTDNNPCASPAAATAADGSFTIVWCANDRLNLNNGWDLYRRTFTGTGTGGAVAIVNTHIYGDQYAPRISALGNEYLVSWTSLGQDGSREGVYAQFLYKDGSPVGGEFLVNTTTAGQQMQATVASDGVSQFLSIWTSFTGAPYNFDLFAQRYINVSSILLAMSAPYVWAPFVFSNGAYQPELEVSWAPLQGLSVSNYEIYVDGAGGPSAIVTSNSWIMTAANGLTTNSTHSFAVDYVTSDGRRSPVSPSASGSTWGGQSWGGIPFEWMQAYYGRQVVTFGPTGIPTFNWPTPNLPLVSGGPTLYQIFLSGGNPTDSSTWLRQQMARTAQGVFLTWNTQAGATYQVQFSTNLVNWSNLGLPRFAAGVADSLDVGKSGASYYRVLLLR